MKKLLYVFLFAFCLCSYANEAIKGDDRLVFATIGLDHSHINNQTSGLIKAGAVCKYVYDKDPKKVESFIKKFPNTKAALSMEEILKDDSVKLIASAIVPNERIEIGQAAMLSGKDFFSDKPAVTSMEQLDRAKALVKKTGKKYIPFFGERFERAACTKAMELIDEGQIGKLVQILILAPHRANPKSRPQWFFEKDKFGGILCDIGSHQFDLFLALSKAKEVKINYSRVDNFAFPQYKEFEDFGETQLITDNGVSCYLRTDWLTPDKLTSWGDGRIFILGTKGYIEIRTNLDISLDKYPEQSLYLCTNDKKVTRIECSKEEVVFFKNLINDIKNRTETANTQELGFKACEVTLRAQKLADESRK